ncbi:MAG TPA: hypothetical protein VK530_09115 [Candidatus Acidoferrum sp.]|nr:hypothetical protein [Candidatus Acidoferrum sp.]
MSRRLPKEKRDKLILVALGTVAAVAAVYFALINIQREKWKGEEKKRVEAEQKVAQGKATLKLEATVESNFTDAAARLKSAETHLASPNDMYSWLIQTMNKFRLGYNVDIPQYSRETPTEVGVFANFPYQAATFTVSGTAHYHDLGKFLTDFENAHPYIRVQNLDLEPAGDATGSASTREKLTFKMNLLTLVRPTAP